ncbi:MAG: tripartite tricarboxylate transporter substrate binding protein [Burkholderiales bacterium]|nr:tripartite tricarboxylate transporter substrate binding protein [Burkholderiales bacterium]
MTRNTASIACALALALTGGATVAQTYPSKPIRIVSPFPPGGTSDILARAIGERLSKEWGQPVVTENRPGAAGNIASEYVARSSPDGHVLYINTVGTHAINPAIYPKLNFDPIKDFTAITNLVALPSLLCAHPSLPARNVRELIALARKHPGELSYSSAGSGSQPHLTAEMFKTMTGTDLLHVPYKGASPQMVALLGGEVAVTWATAPSGVPFVKAGKLRALGVSTARRMPALPEVPTIAEAGVPGYDAMGWNGLVGPAHMPPAVVQKVNAAVVKIFNTPQVRERFVALGAEPIPSTPEAFASLMQAELPKWAKIVKASGARLD